MTYSFRQDILFKHCDPAGIVFFPRYFEMINDCIEAFFNKKLGHSYVDIHTCAAVPTAEISARFCAPSRHGDALNIQLECTRIGNSSLVLEINASCSAETRFTARSVLVFTNQQGVPQPWPDGLRHALEYFKKEQN